MENLYELLEEAVHKVPTKGIVIVNNSQCDLFLTYSELREKSKKIAFILLSEKSINYKSANILFTVLARGRFRSFSALC